MSVSKSPKSCAIFLIPDADCSVGCLTISETLMIRKCNERHEYHRKRCGNVLIESLRVDDENLPTPSKPDHVSAPSAALIGLDDGNTETLSLLLQILGWSCTSMTTPGEFADGTFHLVFVAGEDADITSWLSLRQHWTTTHFAVIGSEPLEGPHIDDGRTKTLFLRVPLDLEIFEAFIAEAVSFQS